MTIQIKVPVLPESVADANVSKWYKKPGDTVKRDENIVDLETDKVMLEVPSPTDGVLKEIIKPEGSTVKSNEIIAVIEEGTVVAAKPAEKPAAQAQAAAATTTTAATAEDALSPAVRRILAEHNLDAAKIKGTGKGNRITTEDVQAYLAQKPVATHAVATMVDTTAIHGREEKRVPMSRLRTRIAQRLLEVQQQTAMLTTFNEINMQPVMDLRAKYKDQFEKVHHAKLGFMSFFVKAAVEALKRFPLVNASIDGNDMIYHGYYDVGIAVSTERGLVVPIVRDADTLSMAGIEKAIADYAVKARDNKLTIEEMTGGTFTITNGGVFGSMLSTPIINPPQSAILGMHNIVKRPVVENDQIVIRPIMYVALSYDHRIIDGKDSVSFLVAIKQLLEDPARLILDI